MLLALGAASSVLDALHSLTSSKSSSPPSTGFSHAPANPLSGSTAAWGSSTPASGSNGLSQLSPATMSALLAAQSQSSPATTTPAATGRSDALNHLFSQLDTDGDGTISKLEFENTLGAGGTNVAQADDVFSKMDSNGDGSVCLDEMSAGLKANGRHRHHHLAGSDGSGGSPGTGSNSDPLLQALQGASSTSVTNSDGSITTSMTYADGSKVTMTSAAAKTASGSATSSYNVIEQMIARQAQAIASSATASLSVSA